MSSRERVKAYILRCNDGSALHVASTVLNAVVGNENVGEAEFEAVNGFM
jgi:hypothetical protein